MAETRSESITHVFLDIKVNDEKSNYQTIY